MIMETTSTTLMTAATAVATGELVVLMSKYIMATHSIAKCTLSCSLHNYSYDNKFIYNMHAVLLYTHLMDWLL